MESFVVFNLLNKREKEGNVFCNMLLIIKDWLDKDWEVRIAHTLIEGDWCANCMANLGFKLGMGLCSWASDSPSGEDSFV